MITDATLAEAVAEAKRFIKTAEDLQKRRKISASAPGATTWSYQWQIVEHSACKRASLDLTRKLADLRQSR